ncbi:hypothetical protein LCM17_15440 [Cereibacter sphaeroides]|nr:hypothetical protein [Cereibacter sphaeroides]
MTRDHRRFDRQLDRLGRSLPGMDGPMRGLTAPGRWWLRAPIAVLFLIGGFLGFLPVLGFWMIPVGLVLLAVDLPGIRPIVARFLVRMQASWRYWRARLPRPFRR